MAFDAIALINARIERHALLPSTNDEAMRLARGGDAGGVWVVAGQQSQGRGRHGRVWSSPVGNLYASLLLIDAVAPALAPQLGFVAGVALAQALREAAGAPDLAIKWPNDIVHRGAKLSGLMLEGAQLQDGRFACVLGFGVNCASHPDDLAYPATNLSAVARRTISPEAALARLVPAFAHWLAVYLGVGGFAAVRAAWLAHAAGLGADIHLRQGGTVLRGKFQTIDESGRLVLAQAQGVAHIQAGDVFLIDPPLPSSSAAAPPKADADA